MANVSRHSYNKEVIHFLGDHRHVYVLAFGETTKAVVYGFVLAAMVQGFLAGIGYSVAGVQAPVLLGATTALLALVPFGATLVWIPVGISLLLENLPWAGIGLLLWRGHWWSVPSTMLFVR